MIVGFNFDGLVKNPIFSLPVIPAEAGIQVLGTEADYPGLLRSYVKAAN